MSLTTLPMALTLDDSQLSSRFYLDNMSEGLYDPSNIGLMLECEDDQTYALPRHNTNGLQLHTSTNVSMRISFSNGGSGDSLSCRYCQCNFLSEAHLMDHMHKFHNDESGDEDADDDQGVEEDHDDDDYDDDRGEGIPGMMSVEKIAEIVKTPVTFPGYLKMATTMHGNVKKAVASPGYVKTKATAATNVKPQGANPGYSKPAVTSPGFVKTAAISPGHMKTAAMSPGFIKTAVSSGKVKTIALSPNKMKPAVTSPGYITAIASPNYGVMTSPVPVYSNGSDTAVLSPHTSPSSTPNPNQVTDLKTLKRKTSISNDAAAPRLTLTIKKSKSTYEVHRDEETSVPVSPVTQMREENCDVQSDSANETIDVESSSPYSSPSSEKNEVKVVANGRKKASGKFVCDQCQKSYVSKYALKRHIATHSDERPFVCTFPDCKGAFKLKSRLTDHIRYVHKRKTPRTVNRSKSVPDTSTSSLAQALLSPSSLSLPGSVALTPTSDVAGQAPSDAVANGKPSSKTKLYKCTVANCNREFRDSYNLASHMCLHTGRMPFKCSMCSFSTIQKASLDWHVQAKHPKS